METADFEVKSDFDGSQRAWLRLVKTVVCLANTAGGRIVIGPFDLGDLGQLDPAKIDDAVNKFVGPRIDEVKVTLEPGGDENVVTVLVEVPDSHTKPHIFSLEGQYTDEKDRHHCEFYRGQIWVRHSASNAPANQDDLDRMFKGRLSLLLTQLGSAILQFPLGTWENGANGMPFHVTDGNQPDAIKVSFVYPYSATQLGEKVDRSANWVGLAANRLGWRPDGKPNTMFLQAIPSANGDYIQQWRYSDQARIELERLLEENPGFNPNRPIS